MWIPPGTADLTDPDVKQALFECKACILSKASTRSSELLVQQRWEVCLAGRTRYFCEFCKPDSISPTPLIVWLQLVLTFSVLWGCVLTP